MKRRSRKRLTKSPLSPTVCCARLRPPRHPKTAKKKPPKHARARLRDSEHKPRTVTSATGTQNNLVLPVYFLAMATMSVGAFKLPEKGEPFSGKSMPVEEFTE